MKKICETIILKSGVTLKNRTVMAPMTTKQSFFNGVVTSEEISYYEKRSYEVGAVITGAAYVQNNGKGWDGELGVNNDNQIEGLTNLASAIKSTGAKAFLQIFHAGRMTNHHILNGRSPVSASAIAAEREAAEVPNEMTEDEIHETIKNFGEATKRAILAGFDGVEIHGANTYLLQQFFSPHSNRRKDNWGGSFEKRLTFINYVIKEVQEVVNNESDGPFAIGYRLSPEEYESPGIRFTDTIKLVEKLCEKNLDYLHLSLKKYNAISKSNEFKDKSMLNYLYEITKDKIPLIGVGNINNKEDVIEALKYSDMIAFGRNTIVDPTFAQKIISDKKTKNSDFQDSVKNADITEALRSYLKGES